MVICTIFWMVVFGVILNIEARGDKNKLNKKWTISCAVGLFIYLAFGLTLHLLAIYTLIMFVYFYGRNR